METIKKEKGLVKEKTEQPKAKPAKVTKKPSTPPVIKKPVSTEDNLKTKLAKVSGKTVEEIKPKKKTDSSKNTSDYDKVMARNKALKEVHEKMDKDSDHDFSDGKEELKDVVVQDSSLIENIKQEQARIEKFEDETKKLQNSNVELQQQLQIIHENKKNLDNTLLEIQLRLNEEDERIRQLESIKNELENSLKSISLESKNYRHIVDKNEQLIKKADAQLAKEKENAKKIKKELNEAKVQIEELKKKAETEKVEKKETISKEDLSEYKNLIKEKDKEVRAKERLIENRDKKIEKIEADLKEAKKEQRAAVSSNNRALKKIETLEESLKLAKKELNAANRKNTKLMNDFAKKAEEYNKAEESIAKEYLNLKGYFDLEVASLNKKLSEKVGKNSSNKTDKEAIDKIKKDYEGKLLKIKEESKKSEDAIAKEYLSLKNYFDLEVVALRKKAETEKNEALLQKEKELNSKQEELLELQKQIDKYKEEICELKQHSNKSEEDDSVQIMQEIKEEVVKNREIMQSLKIEQANLPVEEENLNYEELIKEKEAELEALQIKNKEYVDQIDEMLFEASILNKGIQDLDDKINSISEKDINDVDFKRNIAEIRKRKSELILRGNEEAKLNDEALLKLKSAVDLKRKDIENLKVEILETEDKFQQRGNKSYSDKLEHEKQIRKLNYALDLHQIKLHELSNDEDERLKNKYQIFVDSYNKRMKEYNVSEQKMIEYYLGKTREEVISKEDEALYKKQELEKEELTQKLVTLKHSQRIIAKQIRELKEIIYGLKQALAELNNPLDSNYEQSKDYVLKDIEDKLEQLQKDYAIYQEKLEILNDRKVLRFNIRNKLLLNEQIIFDYAKLFSYLRKTDYLYRQNQTKQKNLNENLSFGEFKEGEKEQIKNEISFLDKEQERLYRSMEETREKLRRLKTHEKVSYFVELENSLARLKIIENNIGNMINDTKNSIEIKMQELNILKTGTY